MVTKENISAEASKLDKLIPDWYKFIDTENLDMSTGLKCVLGQIGRKKYNLEYNRDISNLLEDRFGLNMYAQEYCDNDFKEYWIEEVKLRIEAERFNFGISVKKTITIPQQTILLEDLPKLINELKKHL